MAHLQIAMLEPLSNATSIRQALRHLPMDLDQAYEKTLQMIKAKGRASWMQAERALIWAVYSKRPLHRTEFKHALAIESGLSQEDLETYQEDTVISCCGGLVVVDEESQVVRLIREFISQIWYFTADGYRRDCADVLDQQPGTEICRTPPDCESLHALPSPAYHADLCQSR